jgi:predicted NACHT family NTPase
MIFGNRNAVYSGTKPSEASDGDVTIRELSGGTESADDVRFKVGEKEIRETLGTGLFSTRGSNRIGWGHQTYAEFLAAGYLKKHDVSISQIKSLITHPGDPNKKIIPQLGETAAWLAGMIPEIFKTIVQAEPDLLLRSEVATGDSPQRAALVEALLQLYEDEHAYDRDRQHYKNLAHPGLADQLRPYITDKTKGVIVRRVAIDIAESCNIQALNDVLLEVALDTSDNLASRVQAASAIWRIGDDQTRKRLKPLAFSDDADDLRDELKGSILRALWPSHITARELCPLLRPPKSEGFIGVYRLFLSSELVKDLAPQDLIPALEFVTSLPQPRHEMDSSMESFMDGVVMKAWENMNGPGVTEALARFVASRLKHHDALIKGRLNESDQFTFLQDEDNRRRLLKAVLSVVAEDPDSEGSWLLFTHTPIVRPEDFHWLISWLDQNQKSEIQNVVADLLFRLFNRSPEHLDAIYEAGKKYPLVADRFKGVWEPISFGSAQACQLKAQYEEEETWRRQRDKPPLMPSPAERLARALQECEDRNPAAWSNVTRELTLEPTSTDYNYGFEWDVMKLPGWLSADEVIRERIVRVAEKYVQSDIPAASNWLGTGQWSWSVMSQWSAVALLQQVRPVVMQSLSPDQIGR